MLPSLNVGDVCTMTGCTLVHGAKGRHMQVTYKAGKKSRFVFVFLGTEPDDNSAPLDLEKHMNALGWYRK